jgi:hypothetical protein
MPWSLPQKPAQANSCNIKEDIKEDIKEEIKELTINAECRAFARRSKIQKARGIQRIRVSHHQVRTDTMASRERQQYWTQEAIDSRPSASKVVT